MATYLLIAHHAHLSARVAEFLAPARRLAAEDLVDGDLGPNHRFVLLARGASGDRMEGSDAAAGRLFRGTLLDRTRRAVAFGAGGVAALERSRPDPTPSAVDREGSFLDLRWRSGHLCVRRDFFAMLPLLYAAQDDAVCVSDSLFLITRVLKAMGRSVAIDPQVATARCWAYTMGSQQIGVRTVFEGVRMCPLGGHLDVTADSTLRLAERRADVPAVLARDVGGYRDTIRAAAQDAAALLRGLLDHGQADPVVALSGGMDSRICAAAALLAAPDRRVPIKTRDRRHRDIPVVNELLAAFPFQRVHLATGDGGKRFDRLASWILSNAGLYDVLLAQRRFHPSSPVVAVGGHGVECFKGNYEWQSLAAVAAHVAEPVRSAFLTVASEGLVACGCDPDHRYGAELFYLLQRSPIHFGRGTAWNLTGLHPMLQKPLVGLAYAPHNPFPGAGKGRPGVATDLLIAMNPDLARHRFDKAAKAIPARIVDERVAAMGTIDPRDCASYSVFGQPSEVVNGPSDAFTKLARADGFSGRLDVERLAPFAAEALDRIADPGLRRLHAGCLGDLHRAWFTSRVRVASRPWLARLMAEGLMRVDPPRARRLRDAANPAFGKLAPFLLT